MDPKKIEKQKNINLKGLAFHIGSDIKDFSYFQKALQVMLEKIKYLNIEEHIEFLDVGGGLAIKYFDNDEVLSIQEFVTKVKALVPEKLNLIFEPGKSIIGKDLSKYYNLKFYLVLMETNQIHNDVH